MCTYPLTRAAAPLQVHFVGAECNENGTRYDGDSLFDEQARQVGIFQQLSTALTPRFQLEMRGVLVRVMPDHRPAPEVSLCSCTSK